MDIYEQRYRMLGILGTIAFHLIILISFLSLKLGKVKSKHKEQIVIEFAEDEFKTIEEIIKEQKIKNTKVEHLSQKTLTNIVSNVSEKMDQEISTERYLEEVMNELGIEDMNPKHSNELPDDPVLMEKEQKEIKETKTNFGPTRIEINIPPRKPRYVYRPIYKCQGGGTIIVAVTVNQEGEVIQASVISSTTDEICVVETALKSAKQTLVTKDYNSDKKLKGTIKYIFVAQ